MKQIQIILLFLLLSCKLLAQLSSGSSMSVSASTPVNFSLNTITDYTQKQTIRNAVQIKLSINRQNCLVSAQVSSTGTNVFDNSFSLQLSSKTSPAIIASTEIPLTPSAVLLFNQPKPTTTTANYTYVYDALFTPPTTFVAPGSYSYSILFTMTPQ